MRRTRRRPPPFPATTQRWLITYTDLCTLLLSFFVLLVSMSTLDVNRQKKALGAIEGKFGESKKPHASSTVKSPDDGTNPEAQENGRNADALKALSVEGNLSADQLLVGKSKTMVRIDQKVLFRPGTTDFNPEIQKYLSGLASYLSQNDADIEIRGHTDIHEGLNTPNWPLRSWELSTRRALAVYSFFAQKEIKADRMSAHGFSYFQPIVDSRTFPQMSEKNQRVEILLGPNHSLPPELIRQDHQSNPFFNYKHFFFRLYSPQEEKDKQLEPWVKRFYEAVESQEQQ